MPSYTLTINAIKKTITADPDMPLLWVIRDILGLTGTKYGCGKGLCGSCTVLYNGEAVRSCSLPIASAQNGTITTIEGISQEMDHPLQQAWKELDVSQCGYCQSGQIMSAVSLLAKNADPSETVINKTMAGNLCRCGTYVRIRKAIQRAARHEKQ